MGGHQQIIKSLNYSNYGCSFVSIYGIPRYRCKFSVKWGAIQLRKREDSELGCPKIWRSNHFSHFSTHSTGKNPLPVLKGRLSNLKETAKNQKEFSSWMPTGRNNEKSTGGMGCGKSRWSLCTKTWGHFRRLQSSSMPAGITRHEANFNNILFRLVIVVFTQYIVI